MLFCAPNLNLRKDFKMRKMKSVPIIFFIFISIIFTIPAYAAGTKKITSVSIQRIYKAKRGKSIQIKYFLNPAVPNIPSLIRKCMISAIYQSVLIWTTGLLLMLKKGMISNG